MDWSDGLDDSLRSDLILLNSIFESFDGPRSRVCSWAWSQLRGTMTAEEFARSFPSSIPLPNELLALCHWYQRNGTPISGYFRLCQHEDQTIRFWFGSEKAIGSLGIFGATPDGSLYCVWRQDDGRTPIVHLGSEGEGNFVLASNTLDFLRLLAIGYDEIGFADLSSPPDGEDVNPAFQAWVTDTFNVSIPEVGAEITRPAQDVHNDFQDWIDPRIGYHH